MCCGRDPSGNGDKCMTGSKVNCKLPVCCPGWYLSQGTGGTPSRCMQCRLCPPGYMLSGCRTNSPGLCVLTCDAVTCPPSFVKKTTNLENAKTPSSTADYDTCCDKMCSAYACTNPGDLKINLGSSPASNALCCSPACSSVTNTSCVESGRGYIRMGFDKIPGSTTSKCCAPACSLQSCPSGWANLPNSDLYGGSATSDCCYKTSIPLPSSGYDFVSGTFTGLPIFDTAFTMTDVISFSTYNGKVFTIPRVSAVSEYLAETTCTAGATSSESITVEQLLKVKSSFISNSLKMGGSGAAGLITPIGGAVSYTEASLGGSLNGAFQKVTAKMQATRTQTYISSGQCVWMKLTMQDPTVAPLKGSFLAAVASLPTGGDNIAPFVNFLQMYGTHYVQQASLGGMYTLYSMVDTCALQSLSSSSTNVQGCVAAQVQHSTAAVVGIPGFAAVGGAVSAGADAGSCSGFSTGKTSGSGSSRSVVQTETDFVGGSAVLGAQAFDSSTLSSWASGIQDSPAMFPTKLMPMWSMVQSIGDGLSRPEGYCRKIMEYNPQESVQTLTMKANKLQQAYKQMLTEAATTLQANSNKPGWSSPMGCSGLVSAAWCKASSATVTMLLIIGIAK